MCHYLGGGLHGRKKRVKAQSESSKSVVNSVLISREMPVFPGFLEIIRVVNINSFYLRYAHKPFIKGHKKQIEVVMMYLWLHQIEEDKENYWDKYLETCND